MWALVFAALLGPSAKFEAEKAAWAGVPQADMVVVPADLPALPTREEAQAGYRLATAQYARAGEVLGWNGEEAYALWKKDVDYRVGCWAGLVAVHNRAAYRGYQSRWDESRGWWRLVAEDGRSWSLNVAGELDKLRKRIGDDGYFAGRMPSPAPAYVERP